MENLKSLELELQAYRRQHGAFPETLEKLGYDEHTNFALADAFGQPLHYQTDGQQFELVAFGNDGQPGGAGLDADVTADHDVIVYFARKKEMTP